MKLPFLSRKKAQSQLVEVKAYFEGRLDQFLRSGYAQIGVTADSEYIIDEIGEGYKSVITYYRAVNLISQVQASIPLKLFQSAKDQDEEIFDHPLGNLFLKDTKSMKSPYELREFLILSLLCTGNGYLYCPRSELSGNRLHIQTLLSPNMRVERTGLNDPPAKYTYITDREPKPLAYEDILHLRLPNPCDDLIGLSPVQVARYALKGDVKAQKWNNNLLTNDMRPSGIIYSDTILNISQSEEIRKRIKEEWSGAENAGKIPFLEGMKFQTTGLSPKDMEWLMTRKLNRQEVATLLGVPAELLGDSEAKTYSNYREARIALFEQAIQPLLTKEIALYNRFFFPEQDFYFVPDMSQIDALKRNESELLSQLNQSTHMTMNEKRKMQNLPELPPEIGDRIYLPATYVPLDMLTGGSQEEI